MPLVQVFTSAPAPAPEAQKALLGDLSKLLAARFGKPERWVMTCLQPGLGMTFGGSPAPAAFVAVKNVGKMTPDDTARLSGDRFGERASAEGSPDAGSTKSPVLALRLTMRPSKGA